MVHPCPNAYGFQRRGLLCLGYDWEELVRRFAPVLVSGLKSAAMVHPCPNAYGFQRRGLLCLGYDWEEVVRRFAPVLVSGLKSAAMVHPCPNAYGFRRRGCYTWVMIGRKWSGALRLFL